jgi:hypothetical protein
LVWGSIFTQDIERGKIVMEFRHVIHQSPTGHKLETLFGGTKQSGFD